MRLVGVIFVGSLGVISSCSSDETKPTADKPVPLTAEQQKQMRELEAQVRTLELERAKLYENLPTMAELQKARDELEERKTRLQSLTQRDKVIPCLVAELATITQEGTSIEVVEIAAEGLVIEMPIADGSKFEPQLNACGAVGASKKIDGGWAFEAKLKPVDPPSREKTKPEPEPQPPPGVSVLGQLPQQPQRRLTALRSAAAALTEENEGLRKKTEEMASLVERRHELLAAERSVKAPPDIDGAIETVNSYAKSTEIEVKSVRPENSDQMVRLHVELNATLKDIDALLVKLQTRPMILVVETLVLKPGNGEQRVPARMTLASPRL